MRTRACEKRESGKQALGVAYTISLYVMRSTCGICELKLKRGIFLNTN